MIISPITIISLKRKITALKAWKALNFKIKTILKLKKRVKYYIIPMFPVLL